jgi:nucleotidyltransferase/DNA polymerase involved in DNA repair
MSLRSPVMVIPPGEEGATLAALPLIVLDLPERESETFTSWGIHTLGMLAALPEKELIARMGQRGKRLRQLASGKIVGEENVGKAVLLDTHHQQEAFRLERFPSRSAPARCQISILTSPQRKSENRQRIYDLRGCALKVVNRLSLAKRARAWPSLLGE